MKKIVLVLALVVSSISFAQTTITKQLGEFETVKVFNGITLELIQSNENKIEISGAKAEKVKIKNSNGVLKITLKFPDLNADGKAEAKLYYNKELKKIDANEAATVTGKGFDQTHLEVKTQERAFVNLVVNIKHLKVKSSSGGIVKLSGSAKNQEIDLDLYGVYHGYNLKVSDNTTIRSGSGAKAEIFAGETLNAKVTFGGSIFYKGNPEVIKDKKVVGGIIKKTD